jgi:multiple sugar transport system substrate-binding protein
MVQEIKNGTVPKANSTYMEEESRRAFESGKAIAMRNWPYAYALGKKSSIGSKFAVAPLPAFEGGKAAGVLGGYNLGISAFTKNEKAAVEFVNYITNKQSQLLFGTKSGLPPVLTSVYDDPAMKKAAPYADQLRTAIEQAQPRPVSPVYTQISEAIYKNVYKALQGNQDPKAALDAASSAVDKALQTF